VRDPLRKTKARARSARHPRPTERALPALDLFSGAGGLSLGLEAAGFAATAAVEREAVYCETYARLFPKVEILCGSVQQVRFRRFRGIPLIAGGPPCQPFSSGGKQRAAEDDRDMIPEFLRAVREARPQAFLMENVPGLASPRLRPYLDGIVVRMERLGYTVSCAVLHAAQFGVPQKRRRLFVVGTLGDTFEFPSPTHGPGTRHPIIPARSILSEHQAFGIPNRSKVFYAKRPDLRQSPYAGQIFNGGGRPIDLDSPCHTVLASAGGNKTHFVDTRNLVPPYFRHLKRGGKARKGVLPGGRRITVEESALLQTFPGGVEFAGSRSRQYAQVGNAVPPLLAQRMGEVLLRSLGAGRRWARERKAAAL